MTLYLHMREKAVTTLGPGKRYGLWVAGCNRRCPGCIAPEAQDMTKGTPLDVGGLVWEILHADPEGLTISGGEPFLQAPALAELIRRLRAKKDFGVIVYTGFLLEELDQVPGGAELLKEIDLLIDGPYIQELDDGKSLRGSSNQRVIPLTDRYRNDLEQYGIPGRSHEIFHRGFETHYVGIPENSEYK